MTLPRMGSVAALYALQNSMMLTPWGPRAVPTGGAGVAWPALSCTLTSAATFFLGGMFWSLRGGGWWWLVVVSGRVWSWDGCGVPGRQTRWIWVKLSSTGV